MLPERPPIYSYSHTMRSRYGETDKMGYVYYGRYLEYFEVGRTEMIRSVGFPYRKLEEQGIMLPVVESHVQYKAPLFYDDLITVNIYMYDMPAVKLVTYYQMFTERQEKLHAAGKVVLCFMKEDTRKPCRAPKAFIDKLTAKINDSL